MKKELKRIIQSNTAALKASAGDFEAIYRISFSNPGGVLAEDSDSFRIRTHTYGNVAARVEQVAAGLYRRIGETHGWVGLEMENGVDWIAAFWGLLKSGNKPYLINTRHPKSLSDRILKTLGITQIVCLRAGELNAEYIPLFDLPAGDSCPAAFENEIAIASSATSLKESICFYTGANVTAQILNTESVLRSSKRIARHYKGSLKQLAFLPFYHIFGLFAVYFWFTFYQRTLVFLPDLAPDTILKTCRKHQVTHIFAVPLLWHTIEKSVLKQAARQGKLEKLQRGVRLCTALQNLFPYAGATLSKLLMRSVTDALFGRSVQFCISGGSFLRGSALELLNGIGYPLHNGYGMSEIGIAAVELRSRPRDRNRNAIGRPFASLEYRIDADGVLWVRGPSVCAAQMIDGEKRCHDGWLCTEDIAKSDEDGVLSLLGRKSDVVIADNGENISPDTLEPLFFTEGALDFCILGLGEAEQEELAMVVQVSPYLPAARLNALQDRLLEINRTLPPTHQIRRFYMTCDALASPTAIKISRAALKRAIAAKTVTLSPFEKREATGEFDPESPLARKVLEVVSGVIGTPAAEIPADAHLMLDLGIDSLQYFAILAALAEAFGLSANVNEQYAYTVREFCEYIERQL